MTTPWEQQVKLTEEWIRGETVIPEIAHLWPPGLVGTLQVLAPPQTKPGETVNVRAVVVNRKAGLAGYFSRKALIVFIPILAFPAGERNRADCVSAQGDWDLK